ncbi:MAG TPA: hypothetical protein VFG03_21880 [Telluria sp.]|nr:hypothetical protein [Telluria sp.]
MNLQLGLRALALLAFVAASTTLIVQSDLIGGANAPHQPVAAVGQL